MLIYYRLNASSLVLLWTGVNHRILFFIFKCLNFINGTLFTKLYHDVWNLFDLIAHICVKIIFGSSQQSWFIANMRIWKRSSLVHLNKVDLLQMVTRRTKYCKYGNIGNSWFPTVHYNDHSRSKHVSLFVSVYMGIPCCIYHVCFVCFLFFFLFFMGGGGGGLSVCLEHTRFTLFRHNISLYTQRLNYFNNQHVCAKHNWMVYDWSQSKVRLLVCVSASLIIFYLFSFIYSTSTIQTQ